MSNQSIWKARTELNKVILLLNEAKHNASSDKIVEMCRLITELAAIRERISVVLDDA